MVARLTVVGYESSQATMLWRGHAQARFVRCWLKRRLGRQKTGSGEWRWTGRDSRTSTEACSVMRAHAQMRP